MKLLISRNQRQLIPFSTGADSVTDCSNKLKVRRKTEALMTLMNCEEALLLQFLMQLAFKSPNLSFPIHLLVEEAKRRDTLGKSISANLNAKSQR